MLNTLRSLGTALALCLGGGATAAANPPALPFSPYDLPAGNVTYNLLFCDDPAAFAAQPGTPPTGWQVTLASADVEALRALANDGSAEGRVRYLAYDRLRALGKKVPPKVLLGVIIEFPFAKGLDALAAFSDGGVRYVNRTGKVMVVDGRSPLEPLVKKWFAVSAPLVARIGPWNKPRLAPPKVGNVRLSFLVSDGLYFGEGPVAMMQNDPLAGPVFQQAAELLTATVDMALK